MSDCIYLTCMLASRHEVTAIASYQVLQVPDAVDMTADLAPNRVVPELQCRQDEMVGVGCSSMCLGCIVVGP